MNYTQKSNQEIASFWDSTGEWRLDYFHQLKATPDAELSLPLRVEKEFVIAEEEFMSGLIQKSSSIIELGCGVGRSIVPFILQYPKKSFLGVDIAPYQIELFRRQIEKYAVTNASALCCDVSDLRFAKESFDLVLICNHTYGNFLGSTRERMLRGVKQILRSDGTLMIGGFTNFPLARDCYREWGVKVIRTDDETGFVELEHYHSFWQSEDSVVNELKSFGFSCVETRYTRLGFIKAFQASNEFSKQTLYFS